MFNTVNCAATYVKMFGPQMYLMKAMNAPSSRFTRSTSLVLISRKIYPKNCNQGEKNENNGLEIGREIDKKKM